PIAMVGETFPAFLFAPPGVTWPSISEMYAKLAALKAETLVITDASNRAASVLDKQRVVTIPARIAHKGPLPADIYTPIPYIIPAQMFAAALAEHKGLNPDNPRTLSKVTRTL
ncbi:MAG: glutamine--fructose-6-phosphate aminotransferase, partial [Candidatus Solibacter usitatus]|nr:glutamine--fructose-6-phosphate aminotransferase [Candidatus Solibacter usitatus]